MRCPHTIPGVADGCIYSVAGLRGSCVTSQEALTDEGAFLLPPNQHPSQPSVIPLRFPGWEKVKLKVMAALDRQRAKRLKREAVDRQFGAQRSLRKHYNAFKHSLPASARPFIPLFVDFLVLPSVKELWQPGEKVSSEQWQAQLDSVREEVDQFRVDLVSHAREIILAATTDPDKAQDDATSDELLENLDDAFFNRATSFVCCGFPGCPPAQESHRVVRQRTPSEIAAARPWQRWTTTWEPRLKDRYGAIGPLVAVLQHQHADHNCDKQLPTIKTFSSQPSVRITLPLEVACAISALLEVGDLDTERAGQSELDELNKEHFFEWENTKTYRRFFYEENAWQELVRQQLPGRRKGAYAGSPQVFFIKRRGEKLAKLKNPEVLDPPCIVMKKSPWKVERQARIAAEAEKKVADGVQQETLNQARKFAESSDEGEEPLAKDRNSSSAAGFNIAGRVDFDSDSDSDSDDEDSEEQPARRDVKVEDDETASVGEEDE